MSELVNQNAPASPTADDLETKSSTDTNENMANGSPDQEQQLEEEPLSEDEARTISLECKAKGNEFFATQNYEDAIDQYSLALKQLKRVGITDHIILGNRSAAYLALKRYVPALRDAQLAAEAEPTWWKAHWRSGLALMGMVPRKFRTEQAIKSFEACRSCAEFPESKQGDLQNELQKAYARLQQQENEVSMPENCTIS
mmetsp:Transcript_28147/g.36880  ORF Transcript_28147/g.36880 Transcript_28147/m.36880 type:complete len:199 (+) Transcript_28147:30-626(+)|eukprot:CAMPEP_0117758272 /NCGR_PEP_ID=MMETSP0947-20121206/15274_1 /TAXON_ID=44440 /ORGANISM="Chattonella subsalsa, Strain CCMP2191" /LENGTH=198 /DNA_ID=CAMNT_0005578417 /DNA_START=30 /DNA_END=629 /DNA_ORIENTATION=+